MNNANEETTEATKPHGATLETVPVRRWWLCSIATLSLVALAIYVLFCGTHFSFRFPSLRFMDHYAYQANGWYHRHLYLCAPDGGPLPSSQYKDCSFYRDLPYAYWGPVPALFPLVLNNVLGLGVPTSAQLYFILLLTLMVLLRLAYRVFQRWHGPDPRRSLIAATVLTLAVGTSHVFLHMSIVPYSWFMSIATAQLFLLLSLHGLLSYEQTSQTGHLAWAGLWLALATLSKQHYLLAVGPVWVFVLVVCKRTKEWMPTLLQSTVVLVPVIAALGLQLWLNHVRFGSIFETGTAYMNQFGNVRNPNSPVGIQYCALNFWNYFYAPVRWQNGIPRLTGGQGFAAGPVQLILVQHFVPIYAALPLLSACLAWPFTAGWRVTHGRQLAGKEHWAALLAGVALVIFAVDLCISSVWLRYFYDPFPALALLATGIWLDFYGWLGRRALRRVFCLGVAVTLAWQAFVGLDATAGLLFSRSFIFMKSAVPDLPDTFTRNRFFAWLYGCAPLLHLSAQFSVPSTKGDKKLVEIGSLGHDKAFLLRPVDAERMTFVFQNGIRDEVIGTPRQIGVGAHTLDLRIETEGNWELKLDGQSVLQGRADFTSVRRDELKINPVLQFAPN